MFILEVLTLSLLQPLQRGANELTYPMEEGDLATAIMEN